MISSQRTLLSFVALAIVALPHVALGQCDFGAAVSAIAKPSPLGKLNVHVEFPVNWANVDPIAHGASLTIASVNIVFDPGTFTGGGTKGWYGSHDGNSFTYVDRTGVNPKYKVTIHNHDGNAEVAVKGKKASLTALSGTVGDDFTPQATFMTNGEGCTTGFQNEIPPNPPPDYVGEGENCKWSGKPGWPPWVIKCRQFPLL
jgi:hypothetical protein